MGLRRERTADQIRDLLAACFMGGRMQDPRLSTITITAVKLSADLQIATVYFRLMGDSIKLEDAMQGLKRAEGYLRRELAQNLDIRRVPTLRFFFDESVERGARIEQLLSDLD